MNRDEIVAELFRMQDKDYAVLQATPALRAFAKRLSKDNDVKVFLSNLPHQYFDEDQLHAFVISLEKEFDKCIEEVEAFLPFIDNWATCDQLSPKAFKKEPEKLLPYIQVWIRSDKTYTVRFAIGMLMQHFLDERFDTKYADLVAEVRSEEYYVNMMIAWYFATALAKQYEATVLILEAEPLVLSPWVQNKTIQKACESYRVSDDQKTYLRTLKIPVRKSDAK